jgi:protein-S-isoprenylcysteine O-methyltransferase Ste14
VPLAAGTDLLLLLLFAVQHTVMARPSFKRRRPRLVPDAAERATFVLAANLALALLFWLWRPIGGTVWSLNGRARLCSGRCKWPAGWWPSAPPF